MTQGQIDFDPPSNGTATSDAAAESMRAHTARLRMLVLSAIAGAGSNGLTSDEAEQLLSMSHQTVSARFNELMRMGEIEAIGRRKTRSGRTACVWVQA